MVRGLIVHIEQAISRYLGTDSQIEPKGPARLVERALSPLTRNYVSLTRALDIDPGALEWDKLPSLIRENIDAVSAGVIGKIREILMLCKVSKTASVSILNSDSDLHADFNFSSVVEIDGIERFAFKCRDAGSELFLARMIAAAELDDHFFVPDIQVIAGRGYKQSFVARAFEITSLSDSMLYEMGRFAALAQLLGANDLHEENVIFDGERFGIVDGETLFQPQRTGGGGTTEAAFGSQDLDCKKSSSVLATHLFTHADNACKSTILGSYSRFIRSLAEAQRVLPGLTPRELDLLISGYRASNDLEDLIIANLPLQLVVRKVLLPTAVYAGLVTRESIECLHAPREAFVARIAAALDALSDVYEGPVESAARELANSIIPFYQTTITKYEMKSTIINNANRFRNAAVDNEKLIGEFASCSPEGSLEYIEMMRRAKAAKGQQTKPN